MRWLPIGEAGEMACPANIFRSGEVASSHALKGWVFPLGKGFPEEMANALAIRREWSELTLKDWERWLEDAQTLDPQNRMEDREKIRRLYVCLLENAEVKEGITPFEFSNIWWMTRLPDCGDWQLATTHNSNGAYFDRPEYEQLRLAGVVVFPARLSDNAAKAEAFFGMRRLSQRLKGLPHARGQWEMTEMLQRVKDRRPYVLAYLAKSRNEQGRQQLRSNLDLIRVKGAIMLHISWDLDGTRLAEQEQSSFAHEVDGIWNLYLKANKTPANDDPAWERLAQVILLACGLSPNEQASNVKDLLIYEETHLKDKLINLGVAPETVEDAQRAAIEMQQPPTFEAAPINIFQSEPVITNDESHANISDNGITPISESSPPNRSVTSPSTRPPDGNQRPHPETGLDAQEWLRNELKKALDSEKWNVSSGEVPVENGGSRVDIELVPDLGQPIYIEAKHTTGGPVYWSERQIETAKRHPGRYYLALLHPNSEGDYEVRWVFDPLAQLVVLKPTVSWTWKVFSDTCGMGENWQPSDSPPTSQADGFKAVITITPNFRDQLPMAFEALKKQITELDSSDSSHSARPLL